MKFQLVNFADLLPRFHGMRGSRVVEKRIEGKMKILLEALFQIKSCCFRRSHKILKRDFNFWVTGGKL